ncbi:MAG: peptidase, partial [Gemmatimonadales bacterium]
LFYAPGSILAVRLEGQSAITSGVPDLLHVFFDTSPVFDVSPPARTLARYVNEPLRSGYADHEDYIVDRAAMVDIPVGEGRIVLIGFRPQHRGQTYGTFKLLFNSVLLGRLP